MTKVNPRTKSYLVDDPRAGECPKLRRRADNVHQAYKPGQVAQGMGDKKTSIQGELCNPCLKTKTGECAEKK